MLCPCLHLLRGVEGGADLTEGTNSSTRLTNFTAYFVYDQLGLLLES